MNTITAMILAMRPKQWIKNLIVFAGYIFSLGERGLHPESEFSVLLSAFWAFAAFCFVSSTVYIFNDISDVDEDRQHPKKRNRPIASGALSISGAWILLAITASVGLALAFSLSQVFGYTVTAYLVIFFLYTVKLKQVAVLDVLIIALGFVLRAVGGAVAVRVGISAWLIICTIFLALFLGFGKRRSEKTALGENATKTRATLDRYSVAHLDFALAVCASLALICYTMYVLGDRSFGHVGLDSLLTLPFVIYGIFRYLFLVVRDHRGDDPTTALLTDIPLLLSVTGWGALWIYLMLAQPGLLNGVIIL